MGVRTIWASMGQTDQSARMAWSTSSGSSWHVASGIGPGFMRGLSMYATSDSANRTLYVTCDGLVFKSTTNGNSWSSVHTGNLSGKVMYSTAVDRYNGTVYAGGPGGLYKSTDSGSNWSSVGVTGMTDAGGFVESREDWQGVHQVVTNSTAGRVYVAAYQDGDSTGGLYVSTNYGASWAHPKSAELVRSVDVSWISQEFIMLGSSRAYTGAADATDSEGLLRSVDGGTSWSSYTSGLPFAFVARVVTDPFDFESVIIGAPGSGFLRSTIECSDPCPIERPGEGGGESAPGAVSGVSSSLVLALESPQPSPSRGLSTVSWSIPQDNEGRSFDLSLFDVAGRRVSVLAEGIAKAGRHSHELAFTSDNGTVLRNGVFFIRLRVGSEVVRRSVILSR